MLIKSLAWFPINVSVLATNWSCVLVRTLLHFAGFHRLPSLCLLQVFFLYMEVCISPSASGIEVETTTFWKSLLYSLFLALLFFQKTKIFVCCIIGSHRSQSQHISAQASHSLAKVQHVQLCFEHTGFCWDCLWALVPMHRETSSAVVLPPNTCTETSLKVSIMLLQ